MSARNTTRPWLLIVVLMVLSSAPSCAPKPPPPEQTPTTSPIAARPAPAPTTRPGPASAWGSAGHLLRSSPNAVTYVTRPASAGPDPAEVTQHASCVLQIDTDVPGTSAPYSTTAMNAATVANLLTSSGVLDHAAQEVLSLSPEEHRQDVLVGAASTGPRFVQVDVWLKKGRDYAPDAAARLMGAAVARMRLAVAESVEAQRRLLDERRAKSEHEAAAVRDELAKVQQKVREYKAGAAAAQISTGSGGDLSYTLNNIRQQWQQVDRELARNRARLEAYQPDPSGAQSPDTRRFAGGGSASELSSIKMSIVDGEARLRTMSEQMKKLEDKSFLALAEQYPDLQREESRLKNVLTELTNRADPARRAASGSADHEVRITVLDGKPDDAAAVEKD